jgi:hypothetical protein
MKRIVMAGAAAAALVLAPSAGADPTPEHGEIVLTETPKMTCQLGSDDADPRVGPTVVCQGDAFPGSADLHQVVLSPSGTVAYRDANIGVGYDGFNPRTLTSGNTYHIHGWTVVPKSYVITFTNDDTGHGMNVLGNRDVDTF